MEHLLTPGEMAGRLKISTKTLKRRVRDLKIPHILIGKLMRFDRATVEAFLVMVPASAPVTQKPKRRNKIHDASSGRFAERLGLV